jgi:hypothetical protein
MYIQQSRSILRMLALGLLVAWTGLSQATTLGFSGHLDLIETNTGTGRYAGASPGQLFSGVFSYGTLADATTDPQFPGDYDFSTPPYSGSITDGTTQTTGAPGEIVQVSVTDDQFVDAASAVIVNAILGTSLAAGDTVDTADIDTQYVFPTGGSIVFGLTFVTLDSTTFSGTGFGNFPPEAGNIDRAFFFISEFDDQDNLVYQGFGELDTLAPVPAPPAIWLFGTGLLGLIGYARRRG